MSKFKKWINKNYSEDMDNNPDLASGIENYNSSLENIKNPDPEISTVAVPANVKIAISKLATALDQSNWGEKMINKFKILEPILKILNIDNSELMSFTLKMKRDLGKENPKYVNIKNDFPESNPD